MAFDIYVKPKRATNPKHEQNSGAQNRSFFPSKMLVPKIFQNDGAQKASQKHFQKPILGRILVSKTFQNGRKFLSKTMLKKRREKNAKKKPT